MKLRLEQLQQHLANTLLPIYCITGNEPLLAHEATEAIRRKSQTLGYQERQSLIADAKFNWQTLIDQSKMLSLFSDKKVIELQMPSGKPGEKGSKILRQYCESPPANTLLILSSGKIETASQRTQWFKSLDTHGAIIQIWPIEKSQLPRWLTQRLAKAKLTTNHEGLTLIAEYTQGNLLAAKQAIEKLRLVHQQGNITPEQITNAITDSAKFDIFQLADAALAGDTAQAIRIFQGLKADGTEAILVLWVLAREIRQLVSMSHAKSLGTAIPAILQQYRVWQKRKSAIQAALNRYDLFEWEKLLQQASDIDRIIKGIDTGNSWDALLRLTLTISTPTTYW